jgi:DNA-binding winged helix-turn-helix (wHTH) protein
MFNNHSSSEPNLLIVGDYLFNPMQASLSGPLGAHHICPRLATLLSCLVGHADEIVEREALIQKLWPDGDGTSGSLSRCVSRLRNYLGDKASSAQYIETVPNRGYRLLAPVYGSTLKPRPINVATIAPASVRGGGRFRNLIGEFRERKVCRSMLIYTLVIWLVFQISEIVVPAVGLPDWVNSLIVILGILGFPIAAVLSWIFDITSSGLTRERELVTNTVFGSSRNKTDLVFDSTLVITALTICGSLVASSLG